jgi:hypothetical protein
VWSRGFGTHSHCEAHSLVERELGRGKGLHGRRACMAWRLQVAMGAWFIPGEECDENDLLCGDRPGLGSVAAGHGAGDGGGVGGGGGVRAGAGTCRGSWSAAGPHRGRGEAPDVAAAATIDASARDAPRRRKPGCLRLAVHFLWGDRPVHGPRLPCRRWVGCYRRPGDRRPSGAVADDGGRGRTRDVVRRHAPVRYVPADSGRCGAGGPRGAVAPDEHGIRRPLHGAGARPSGADSGRRRRSDRHGCAVRHAHPPRARWGG